MQDVSCAAKSLKIACNMATSFKKKGSSRPSHPRGTRPSLHNAQLLVSTGVPSLDALLGGGLAVGTVLLLEEDTFGSYSRLLLKYFLSEGIMCGHALFLASASERPEDTLKDLPGAVDDVSRAQMTQQQQPKRGGGGGGGGGGKKLERDEEEEGGGSRGGDEMKIAWRYQNLPKVQPSFSNRFGHFFDLTHCMDPSRLTAVNKTVFNAMETAASSSGQLYNSLRSSIQKTIEEGHFSVDDVAVHQRNILRVALHSLGSPLWLDEGDSGDPPPSPPLNLTQFLHSLRALLRRTYAVAIVTIPAHLMQDSGYVHRLERLCDVVARLESFAGSDKEQNSLFREYHGLFHLQKLPRLNSLVCHFPETLDLAFKLKRKSFSIETLHLPPELGETASRPQEDPLNPKRRTSALDSRRTLTVDSSAGRTATGNSALTTAKPLSKLDF